MNLQSAPPSARVSDVDGFSWVFVEPVGGILVRAVSGSSTETARERAELLSNDTR